MKSTVPRSNKGILFIAPTTAYVVAETDWLHQRLARFSTNPTTPGGQPSADQNAAEPTHACLSSSDTPENGEATARIVSHR